MHSGKVIWKRVEPWQIRTAGLIESFDLRQLNLVILTTACTDISKWIISHEIMSTSLTAPCLTWQGVWSAFHYNPDEFLSLSWRKVEEGRHLWALKKFGTTPESNLLEHTSQNSSKKDNLCCGSGYLQATAESLGIRAWSSPALSCIQPSVGRNTSFSHHL